MKTYNLKDAINLSIYISESLQEKAPHGNEQFPCASYLDYYFDGQEFYPWHWHEEFEIAYVTQGSVTVHINKMQYTLSSGEGIFISAHTLHSFSIQGSEKAIMPNIVFFLVLLYGSRESIYWQKYIKPLSLESAFTHIFLSPKNIWQAQILTCAKDAFLSLTNEEYGYEFYVRYLLSKIILLVLQNFHSTTQLQHKNQMDINRTRQMLSYIQTHFTEHLSIAQIAESVFVSQRECIRCFKNVIRITPMQYIIEMRIQKAKTLLLETDMRIIDICINCGFEDQSYFTKIFRKKTGLPPLKFRQQNEN